jgi:hypothetical protein
VKKIELHEFKTLLGVRKIKEDMAREAEKDPEYYQRLNGMERNCLNPTARGRIPAGSGRDAD